MEGGKRLVSKSNVTGEIIANSEAVVQRRWGGRGGGQEVVVPLVGPVAAVD